MLRCSVAGIVVVALMLACTRSGRPAGHADADVHIADDLAMLCDRVRARDISGWSQPAFRSRLLADVTARVDMGDPPARCQLGRLMRKHARSTCRGIARRLVAACESPSTGAASEPL